MYCCAQKTNKKCLQSINQSTFCRSTFCPFGVCDFDILSVNRLFVYSGRLGVIYSMTPRRPIRVRQGGGGALTWSPPCFLLGAWESYTTPSRTAMHFFIAVWIWVNIYYNIQTSRTFVYKQRFPTLYVIWKHQLYLP